MTVTVGFAPATTPGLAIGGTTAVAEEGAPEGLFAALLAMLAPGATAESAASDIPDEISAADFGALIQTLTTNATAPAKETDTDTETEDTDDLDQSSETATVGNKVDGLPGSAQGKSLLKDLGDALIALNDAVEAGQPIDPALEKKLNEAIDTLAIYLGAVTPAAPAVDPRISALASGEGVLPAAPATTPPPAAPVEPIIPVPTEGEASQPAPQAPVAGPAFPEVPAAPELAVEPTVDLPQSEAQDTDIADAMTAAPESQATTLEEAPEALRQLGLHIGKLVDKLAQQDPELAKKLAALGDALKSGTVADEALTALGLDDAAVEPEIERILEALAAPKPAATKPAEPKPFTAPTLILPEAVAAPAKKADDPAPAPVAAAEPAQAPELEAPEPELSRPVANASAARVEKPEPVEAKPAPASTAATQPNSTDTSTANPASASQPPAAPVARTIHAAYQAPLQQVNLPQVAFEVVRQFEAGNTRFQIRLDPPELGRIDVKLDVDKSGTVSARMTVERPETLDLMQRDQRALQQALQQAGLDANKTNLEFSLRQNPFAQQGGMGEGRGQQPGFGGDVALGTDEAGASELATSTYRGTATAGGVNLFV